MLVLARYIVRGVLGYTALVMSVFATLIGLYLFMTQQDEIGVGHYRISTALLFVASKMPREIFNLLPVGALIGALLSLGTLARSGELIVMRSVGVSVFRIAAWVGMAGVVLVAITWLLGDFIAPTLEQFGRQQKMLAKFNELSRVGTRRLWVKDGLNIVMVQQQVGKTTLGGVDIFSFDAAHQLLSVGHADTAKPGAGQQWMLENYVATEFVGDRTVVTQQPKATFTTTLSAEFLKFAVTEPEVLTSQVLYAYIQHLRANQLEAREYEVAFWARIARTVSLLVIVMLAVPFAFGPMRSTGAGAKTVVGILIGATFFLLAKLLENGGQVFNLSPWIIAWGPTLILAAVTAITLARVR